MKRKPGKGRVRRVRMRGGEAIASLSAIALLVLMFFPWYGVELSGQVDSLVFVETSVGRTAWQTLGAVCVFLALAIAAALAAAVLRLAGSGWRPLIPHGATVSVLGGLAALLVLVRLVFPPGLGEIGGIELEASPGLAAFLGLAAACGIAAGGYRAMREEGSSYDSVAARLSPRPRVRPASRRRGSSSSG